MEFIVNPFEVDKQYFKTQLQQFQFYDKYSRFDYTNNRRETWPETVTRTVNYLRELSQNKLDESVYQAIYNAILNMDVMPAMRLLAMAGDAARRDNTCIYNCSYLPVDSIESFVECMFIAMSGGGVGFSVESRYVNLLPEVKIGVDGCYVIDIEDSTEGWCNAFYQALQAWFNGYEVVFNYDAIRPAGSVLKTKGGRASGSEPLRQLFNFVAEIINNRQGSKLTTLDCHDIMTKIADCVVAGGVRRTAEISLFDFNDEEIRHCKNGSLNGRYNRYNANNSVIIEHPMTAQEFMQYVIDMNTGMNGEPGLVSRYAFENTIPERRNKEYEFGVNPCQPGFATVLTPDGIKTFDDIDIGSIIWSGTKWTRVVNKWETGIKPVYEYKFSGGTFVGTENHRVFQNGVKVECSEAESVDTAYGEFVDNVQLNPQDIIDGLIIGDGSVHKASNNLVYLIIGKNDYDYFDSEVSHLITKSRQGLHSGAYEVKTTIKNTELPYTYNRFIPDRFMYGSRDKICGFLRGLFSANGTQIISGTSSRIQLKQSSEKIIRQAQIMLSSVGIRSYITTNKPSTVKFSNGTYNIKQSFNLNISTDRVKFLQIIGFIQKYKNEKIRGEIKERLFSGTIQSVNFVGHHKVYDITVDDENHSYWTGGLLVSNCGEVVLRPRQFCCLSSVIAREDDTIESLKSKTALATIIGTIQSCADNFPYLNKLNPAWRNNTLDERLIAVDLNGHMDNKLVRDVYVQRALKSLAIKTNVEYAEELDIAASPAVTTVKPSGNSSVLLDVASGVHARWSKYYIRNVSVNVDSPLFQILEFSGAPLTQASNRTYVVSFPVRSPNEAITRHDLTAIQQLDYWKQVKLNWCEHNPSCTVTYTQDELFDIAKWLYQNQGIIGGLSFFPKSDAVYENAPYVEITEDEYKRLADEFPVIDFSLLSIYEQTDHTNAAQEVACMSGVCELVL